MVMMMTTTTAPRDIKMKMLRNTNHGGEFHGEDVHIDGIGFPYWIQDKG